MISALLRSSSLELKKLNFSTFYSRCSETILSDDIAVEIICDYINAIDLINVVSNAYCLDMNSTSIIDNCESLDSLSLILQEISFV